MDDRDQEGGEEKQEEQEVTRYPWSDTEVLFTWRALLARTRVLWPLVRRF